MFKRCALLFLALMLIFSMGLAVEEGYKQLFDSSQDEGQFVVRFLWLGEKVAKDKPGDCMILTSPDGKVMVLDAGHPDAVSYVIKALDTLGIKRIDYLVASHPHIDHIGGFPALIRSCEIGALYTSPLTYEKSSYYHAYLEAAKEKGLEHVILHEGDTFMFGNEVKVKVLNPPEEIQYPADYEKGATQFINDHSLALKFIYGSRSLMLAGDLYVGGEKAVVDRWGEEVDCDFMKANHHGANTSSSSTWRKAASPEVTFITSETIEDLSLAKKFTRGGQKLYHTLLDGSVRLAIDAGGNYEVTTEKVRTSTIFGSN
jgi:competence protein ComEC